MDDIDIRGMDPRLTKAMIIFGLKVSEYVKEMDHDLWSRSIDYAKTFTKVDGIEINYTKDDEDESLQTLLLALRPFCVLFIVNNYRFINSLNAMGENYALARATPTVLYPELVPDIEVYFDDN